MTTIDQRDYSIIKLVGSFKQMTAGQIDELLFPASSSMMPCYRALDRLQRQKFLMRFEHRMVGGAHGGSGQYVWVLDTEGLRLMPDGYRRQRSIRLHTIEIARTFVALTRLERGGALKVSSYLTEPDCHEVIANHRIDPDLFVDLELTSGRHRPIWFEVDMGRSAHDSESDRHIKDKLRRYWLVANDTTSDFWPDYLYERDVEGNAVHDRLERGGQVVLEPRRLFPAVIWLVQNDWRRSGLQRLINQGWPEARQLFRVMTTGELVEWLS